MNILVPISWLRDFLKTEASAEKISETLCLCSQSVEKIHSLGNDQVLEIEITVNRYDCLSILGIAREAAAILPQFKLRAHFEKPPLCKIPKTYKNVPRDFLSVQIQDPRLCPRFTAVLLDNIKIGSSPSWLKERLEKVNLRALNNVVDISNYLMMETGQPIHTFDYDKILSKKMIMRLSKTGETVTTLDGVERKLPGEDIVIEDGQGRLIDLCGIMGGKNSEIDQNTKKVLFFVQAYDPVRIRKTSMSLGLRTEAAARFERGIDLEAILPVISKGVKMIGELCQGKIASDLIDIYPQKQTSLKFKNNYQFIKEKLGIDLPASKIKIILQSLGFKIESEKKEHFSLVVPSWRNKDIAGPEDIVEEVARVYGYFRLPSKIPKISESLGLVSLKKPVKGTLGSVFVWEEIAKDFLKSVGFSETYNLSFVSRQLIEKTKINLQDCLKVKNPITVDLEYMRPSLFPSLLNVFSRNCSNFPKISIFEMANIYLPQKSNLPLEKMRLSGLTNEKNLLELKGILFQLLKELGIYSSRAYPSKDSFLASFWQEQAVGMIDDGKINLGLFGLVSPKVSAKFLIPDKIFAFDLEMNLISDLASDKKIFTPIAKYPPVIEDLSLIFPPETLIGPVLQEIKASNPIIKTISLIDSFKETKTIRIDYQHPDRSLNTNEVTKVREKIIKIIGNKFKGKLKE